MEKKINFRDFDVRVWDNGDLSMHGKDMQCYVGGTHIGIQTNSKDEQIDIEIENVCNDIWDNFKKLNELLNKIESYGKSSLEHRKNAALAGTWT